MVRMDLADRKYWWNQFGKCLMNIRIWKWSIFPKGIMIFLTPVILQVRLWTLSPLETGVYLEFTIYHSLRSFTWLCILWNDNGPIPQGWSGIKAWKTAQLFCIYYQYCELCETRVNVASYFRSIDIRIDDKMQCEICLWDLDRIPYLAWQSWLSNIKQASGKGTLLTHSYLSSYRERKPKPHKRFTNLAWICWHGAASSRRTV